MRNSLGIQYVLQISQKPARRAVNSADVMPSLASNAARNYNNE